MVALCLVVCGLRLGIWYVDCCGLQLIVLVSGSFGLGVLILWYICFNLFCDVVLLSLVGLLWFLFVLDWCCLLCLDYCG